MQCMCRSAAMNSGLYALADRMTQVPELPLLAGVSGGADSVALLKLLLLLREKQPVSVTAVHVNHGLRGENSDGDEAFVRWLCESDGVPLLVYKADLAGRSDEDSARKARYSFFRQAMKESGAQALVLAHHRNDQAETMLMHMFRGAGTAGLSGMRADGMMNGMRIIRPLLHIGREEIRNALVMDGIAWREDDSNHDERYTRNLIRWRILPEIERYFPDAAMHMCAAAELLAEQNDFLDDAAERFLSRYAGDDWIFREPLLKADKAFRSVILRKWWEKSFADGLDEHTLSRVQTEALADLPAKGGTLNLPGGLTARGCRQCLHITGKEKPESTVIPFAGTEISMKGISLCTEPDAGIAGDGKRMQSVPEQLVQGCVLRCRRPGDRIRPFGASGSRKLQDYLTDRGIDAPFRDRIPLLCRGNEVLLCAGVGAGAVPHYEDTEKRVTLIWRGKMPWLDEWEESEDGEDRGYL